MARASWKVSALAAGLMVWSNMAVAQNVPLDIVLYQNGVTYSHTFTSFVDLVDTYKSDALMKELFPSFNKQQDSTAKINYLGILIEVSTSEANKSGSLSIPATGFGKTYTNTAGREATLELVKTDIESEYSKIQSALAATTPNSTIAGNPNSVQSQMVSSQFDIGYATTSSKVMSASDASAGSSSTSSASSASSTSTSTTSSSSQQTNNNLTGLGFRFGRYNQGNLKAESVTLPLSYTWRFDDDERRQVTVFAPLTAGKIEDSKIFNAQLGVSMAIPMNAEWTLSPSVAYGVAGSMDLAQAAQQASVSLTSAYVMPVNENHSLAFGNMVGYYRTLKLKIDDYVSDPKIANTIFRNGVMYGFPIGALQSIESDVTMEFSYINTYYTGSALYNKTTNEVGVTVGTTKSKKVQALSFVRVGLTYIKAKDANGISANVGYWF